MTLNDLAVLVVGIGLTCTGSREPLVSCLGFSVLGGLLTWKMIPYVSPAFMRIGLKGKDMSKAVQKEIPETMGAVPALVYLFCMLLFIPFMFFKFLVVETSGAGNREVAIDQSTASSGSPLSLFPHDKLAEYLSAILSLVSMFILGVADDLFDIRWRDKFFLPSVAAIPLLTVYYVDFGVTYVTVPRFLWSVVDQLGLALCNGLVDLGVLYYVYMVCVTIFCTNSINIYAGINGIEVGQSIVIAITILLNDAVYVFGHTQHPAANSHRLSMYLLLPFIGTFLPLLVYNWFPARVFVGDTFCYFAGMLFAVVGILGRFSKTLLLFLIPQIVNFVYSIPQLFKIVPCPRHRLPRFDASSGLLYPSTVDFEKMKFTPAPWQITLFKILSTFRLLKVWTGPDGTTITAVSNFTIINLVLVHFGPLHESRLTCVLLLLQFGLGVAAIALRFAFAALIFGHDNL